MQEMLKRFTVFARWGSGETEELDVDARNKIEARNWAAHLLREGWQEGWRITKIVERHGLY